MTGNIADRPARVAPGPRGQLWYTHRDIADCIRRVLGRIEVAR